MKRHHEQLYGQRFRRILDFIDRHLDETLSGARLSRIAHFSRFHFQRQFSHHVGVTPYRYILLARLRRASYRLAFNSLESISDLAPGSPISGAQAFQRYIDHPTPDPHALSRRRADRGQ